MAKISPGNTDKFQSRIGEVRRQQELSQREVAKFVNVSENTAAAWDKTIPVSFAIAFNICRFFSDEIQTLYLGNEIQALRNISELRQHYSKGAISQRELARKIRVTENTISTWEKQEHQTVGKLERLCQVLNCGRLSDLYEPFEDSPQFYWGKQSGGLQHNQEQNKEIGLSQKHRAVHNTAVSPAHNKPTKPHVEPGSVPERSRPQPIEQQTALSDGLTSLQSHQREQCQLVDIIGVSLCANLCGAATCTEIEQFGQAQQKVLKQFLPLSHGIPSQRMLQQVLARLDSRAFSQHHPRWIEAIAQLNQSSDHHLDERTAPLLSSQVQRDQTGNLTISSQSTQGNAEIQKTVQQWLELLLLDNNLVTLDIANCSPALGDVILKRGGDYIISLRGSEQKDFRHNIEQLILWAKAQQENGIPSSQEMPHEFHQKTLFETGELPGWQRYWLLGGINEHLSRFHQWNRLTRIGLVESKRYPMQQPAKERQQYYLLSFDAGMNAFSAPIDSHWNHLENGAWTIETRPSLLNSALTQAAIKRVEEMKEASTKRSHYHLSTKQHSPSFLGDSEGLNQYLSEFFSSFVTTDTRAFS